MCGASRITIAIKTRAMQRAVWSSGLSLIGLRFRVAKWRHPADAWRMKRFIAWLASVFHIRQRKYTAAEEMEYLESVIDSGQGRDTH